jgi:hypothetical protein
MAIGNKRKHFSIPLTEEFSFWYCILFLALCLVCYFINDTPMSVRIIAAVMAPMAFTYFVGKSIVQLLKVTQFDREGLSFKLGSYTFIGLIISSAMCFILGTLHLFSAPYMLSYFSVVLLLYFLSSRLRPVKFWKRIVVPASTLRNLIALLGTSLICFLIALWIQPINSFPYLPGWDLYTNMLTVRTIVNNSGIVELNLQYLPTVHYFYSLVSILTGLDPFTLFWGSIYIVFPIAGAALFFFGFRMSRNTLVGICTGILGVTIGTTNETLGFIFPYSSTFGLILTILFNGFLLNSSYRKTFIFYVISVVLVYPFALFANMIFLIGAKFISIRKMYFYLSVVLSILSFLAILYLGGSYFSSFGGVRLSTDQVLSILSLSYAGEKGLLLMSLGFIFMFINKSFDRKFALVVISIVVSFIVIVSGVYFVAYRLEEFMRPFVALIAGYGLASFSIFMSKVINEFILTKKKVAR